MDDIRQSTGYIQNFLMRIIALKLSLPFNKKLGAQLCSPVPKNDCPTSPVNLKSCESKLTTCLVDDTAGAKNASQSRRVTVVLAKSEKFSSCSSAEAADLLKSEINLTGQRTGPRTAQRHCAFKPPSLDSVCMKQEYKPDKINTCKLKPWIRRPHLNIMSVFVHTSVVVPTIMSEEGHVLTQPFLELCRLCIPIVGKRHLFSIQGLLSACPPGQLVRHICVHASNAGNQCDWGRHVFLFFQKGSVLPSF